MKYAALGLCFVLAACCCKTPKDYTVIREVSRPVRIADEVVSEQKKVNVAPQIVQPASAYYTVSAGPVVYYQDVPLMMEQKVQTMVQQPVIQPRQLPSPYVPEMMTAPVPVADIQATQEMAHCVTVLQHPQGRDLVRCLNTDLTCIGAYEKLGYIQLRHSPQFAGGADIESPADYPARQNRINNNIPRW